MITRIYKTLKKKKENESSAVRRRIKQIEKAA